MEILGYRIIVDDISVVEENETIYRKYRKHGKDISLVRVIAIGQKAKEEEKKICRDCGIDSLINKKAFVSNHAISPHPMTEPLEDLFKKKGVNNPKATMIGQLEAIIIE